MELVRLDLDMDKLPGVLAGKEVEKALLFICSMRCVSPLTCHLRTGLNIDSIGCANSFAMANASERLGSYRSVSTALTVCRDTLSRSAKSLWVHPR
jgi:hypothetical protein